MTRSSPASALRFSRLIHSFRFRLTLWFVAILAVILGVFSIFIYYRQIQVLRAETSSRLIARESQLGNYYSGVFHSNSEEDLEHSTPAAFSPDNLPLLQAGDMLALFNPDRRVVQKSANFPENEISSIYEFWRTARNPASPISYSLSPSGSPDDVGGGDYLFVLGLLESEGENGTVLVIGSPLDPGGQMPRLAFTLALVYALTLLVAFGGGYWLANQAMQPVQAITRTAREIGEYDLNRRLNLGRADELGQLADTFDQMLDRLRAAFERQRQFAADASHEIRTPLAIIELEAGRTLERSRTPQEYEAALRIIQSENEWMSCLVNDLLTLARMDSGQAVMQNEKLDISEIVVDVVDRLGPLARKNGVSLQTGDLGESCVWADRTFLTQMLTNLVENGLKYTRGDHARVVVQTGSQWRAGRAWSWVEVADNGVGIPDASIPHLFDRFYRADAARSQEREEYQETTAGSGLGLAIVRSIVQAYGGEVDVHNQPGGGAVFTVRLPGVEHQNQALKI